jgi:hypothetical protein
MLTRAMTALAERHGFNLSVSILSGCPWQLGVVKAKNSPAQQKTCAEAREQFYDRTLEEMDADVVFLTQRSRDDSSKTELTRPPGDDRPVESPAALLVESADRTFDAIQRAGVRALVFQGVWSLREPVGDPLDCLASARRVEQCRLIVNPPTGLLDSIYRMAAARSEDIFTVDINRFLCPAAPVCDPVLRGVPVWRDKRHYTPAAIARVKGRIWAAIEKTGVLDDTDYGA